MKKGKLIGKGMTAEVYEWGQDKALKLYFDKFSEAWIKNEAQIGSAIHKADVPSPEVFGIIDVEDRKGLIFQRIFGKPLLSHIKEEPWKLYYYTQQLAQLQYKIHQCSADGLPSQKERFEAKIKSSSRILGNLEKKILDYLESLPDGKSVCHGDFHINNIIKSSNELVVVDWTSAYLGNPLGDVARTILMMLSPSKPQGTPDYLWALTQKTKWLTYWIYLSEYMRLSKARFENIDAWIIPAAAAKLRDNLPGEEKWLIDTIKERLKHCNV
jgi:uncharacterized protein (TIGR02172 family)